MKRLNWIFFHCMFLLSIAFRVTMLFFIKKKPRLEFLSTDDLVIIKGNYFRLIWDIENCSRVKIEGHGTYGPKGQLIIKADFDQQAFKCWIYGYPKRSLRTISVNTVSVKQKNSFLLNVHTPIISSVDRKTIPSTVPSVPRLKDKHIGLSNHLFPKIKPTELSRSAQLLSINLKSLTHYET